MVANSPGFACYDDARDILAEVIGACLTRVRYLLLLGSNALDRSTTGVHLVDKAIELIFDNVSISARWVMDANAGGLELQHGALADVDPDYGELVDMSTDPQWSRRVGDCVTRAGIALHRPTDIYGEETFGDWVWAVRLEFDGAQPSVIALGDLPIHGGALDPEPRFSPDNLLVLFGKQEAQGYWIESSIDSSWGDTIEP
jgi:hypothetical protein